MDDPKDPDSSPAAGVISREQIGLGGTDAESRQAIRGVLELHGSSLRPMNVPRPERGYWAKLQFGKTMRKPALPLARPGDVISWGRGGDLSDGRRRRNC
jgi:hypothetical protein